MGFSKPSLSGQHHLDKPHHHLDDQSSLVGWILRQVNPWVILCWRCSCFIPLLIGWVWFYDINHFRLFNAKSYIYMICKHFVTNISKWAWTFFFHTQLNGFKYFYQTLIILFDIIHLFADSKVVTSIAIQHYSFAHSQMVPSIFM